MRASWTATRTRLLFGPLVVVMALVSAAGNVVLADAEPATVPGPLVPLYTSFIDEGTSVTADSFGSSGGDGVFAAAVGSANITVNYTGFSPEAQAAFEYAVTIWEGVLLSDVDIVVDATWTPLGSGILGSAGATFLNRDFSGAPYAQTWYPAALSDRLAGVDLNPGSSDIDASFSSAFSNWYLGTDGNTPSGQYDFVTVVLHEVGHGLGFFGSISGSGGTGAWGWGSGKPAIYDVFADDNSGQALLNTSLYPNPSAALGNAVTAASAFFDGPATTAANGGSPPELYTPSSWQSGSSYSHLNEATYPAGHAESLMTPSVGSSEAMHAPGPVTKAILQDMGWAFAGSAVTATELRFTQQPTGAEQGQPLGTQPSVSVTDGSGAVDIADSTTVITLALVAGPGTLTCDGGLSMTASSGAATFTSCSVSAAGTYQIQATSAPVLTPATSSSFVVTAPVVPGTTWYFAEGFTGLGWQTYLYILNSNGGPATVTVTYLPDSGSAVQKVVIVPAQSRRTLYANDPSEGPGPDIVFGVVVTSDMPITVEEMLRDGGSLAHGTAGSPSLSQTWYFAEGFTMFGWQTIVLATNPGSQPALVTVEYQVQGGSTVSRQITVGALARGTFFASDDVPDLAFSAKVTADNPIVSQLVMIDPARGLAHGTMGVTSPATEWHLGEGFTGDQWETFISVGVPGSQQATVTATYNIDGGAPVTQIITIDGNGRGTFIAHGTDSGVGPDAAFGVKVTSNVPIVVQEVLIDPKAGLGKAQSAMASSQLANGWGFAGGSSQSVGDWLTFFTVSNPGGADVTVTATYFYEDGSPPTTVDVNLLANSRTTFASFDPVRGVPADKNFGATFTATGAIVAQAAVIGVADNREFGVFGTPLP